MNRPSKPRDDFQLHHVGDQGDGLTISAYLKKIGDNQSWGQVKQKLAGRHIQINGNLCMDEARRISAKDVVKVWNRPLAKPIDETDLKLVYVDSFLIVVEKPAGVTSVRHFEERNLSATRRQIQPTLDELLPKALAKYLIKKAQSERSEESRASMPRRSERPKVRRDDELRLPKVIAVHRLDRDTSGLMLFARTPQVAEYLGRMFRKHSIDRRYWAVVHGQIESQTIESYLIRDVGEGRRGSTPDPETPNAQHAVTHVRTIEKMDDYSIVECRLETGRTHQIRIHLSEAGHRICGEPLYHRDPQGQVLEDTSGAPRQALHSALLTFTHPMTQEKMEFKSPWPNDLYRWLRGLRK